MALCFREFLFEKYFFATAIFLKYFLALNEVYKAGIEKVSWRWKKGVLTTCFMIKMGIYLLHDTHCA